MRQTYEVAPLPKFIKIVGWGTGVLLAGMTLVGVAGATGSVAAGSGGSGVTAPTSSGSVYSHQLLQNDAQMTQQMSTPNASGPMVTGQTVDPQLQHSRDPEFINELNQHEADINRMLGRGAPGG